MPNNTDKKSSDESSSGAVAPVDDPGGVVERVDAGPPKSSQVEVAQRRRVHLAAYVRVGANQFLAGPQRHVQRDQLGVRVTETLCPGE